MLNGFMSCSKSWGARLDAATDEPFSHYHREAAGSVVTNTYTAQNQRAQS